MVGWLRDDPGWIPELSLVAEADDEIVGHAVASRGDLAGRPALGLGPVSVSPARQRDGVGSALMHAILGADAMGEPVVVLLGSPNYYRHRHPATWSGTPSTSYRQGMRIPSPMRGERP